MSDSSNDEINNLPIKRKRGVVNKNLRKANVRKLERCAGCEYINQKGKTVLARKQKVPCQWVPILQLFLLLITYWNWQIDLYTVNYLENEHNITYEHVTVLYYS